MFNAYFLPYILIVVTYYASSGLSVGLPIDFSIDLLFTFSIDLSFILSIGFSIDLLLIMTSFGLSSYKPSIDKLFKDTFKDFFLLFRLVYFG
jgi:hypothetical protein